MTDTSDQTSPAPRAWWPRLARGSAMVIALLACLDPGCTRERAGRPLVVLFDEGMRTGPADSTQRARVRALLDANVERVPGHLPNADAIVLVGDRVPTVWSQEPPTQPVFWLAPDSAAPSVRLWAEAPSGAVRIGERATIDVHVRAVPRTPGDSVVVTARRDGVLLARVAHAVRAPLTWRTRVPIVPVNTGVHAVQLGVQWADGRVEDETTAWLTVDSVRHVVAALEVRPSWQATFVRRALDADDRLQLSARIAVAREAGAPVLRTRGAAPSLDALPTPPALAALVVGAADALDARDVARLDRWVREAGGSAVLLLDGVPGPALTSWLEADGWRVVERNEPVAALWGASLRADVDDAPSPSDSARAPLRGRTWLVPTRLPPDAEPWLQLAPSVPDSGPRATVSSVVWSRPMGRGTVVVVGAPDAWTFRERTRSDFVGTWPRLLTEAIARRPADVTLDVSPPTSTGWRSARLIGSPEALRDWRVAGPSTLRLFDARGDSLILPVLSEAHGLAATAWRTPETGDWHRLVAHRGDGAASVMSAVLPADPSPTAPADTRALTTLVRATGGAVVPSASWPALMDSLRARVASAPRRTTWHPWRSPWWVLPFASLLLAEWWWRRRQGQP